MLQELIAYNQHILLTHTHARHMSSLQCTCVKTGRHTPRQGADLALQAALSGCAGNQLLLICSLLPLYSLHHLL